MERKELERDKIKKGRKIELKNKENGGHSRIFEILAEIGEGSSTVCYAAKCEGKIGRLKEFYPKDMSGISDKWLVLLNRKKNNQLIPLATMEERFSKLKKEFVNAYKLIEQKKIDDLRHKDERRYSEVLNNYISPFEILYGVCDNTNSEASVYIWTPDDKKGKNFEVYLDEVFEKTEKNAANKVYNILSAMIALTDYACILHRHALLHLDLKPSNFMVLFDGEMEIKADSISVFDIDTLYSDEMKFPQTAGTPGFSAPELENGKVDNKADIYSIGAILFYALAVQEKGKSQKYYNYIYDDIDVKIASSLLMNSSELNSNVYFRDKVCRILKKCLHRDKTARYGSALELKTDLLKARAYLVPEVENQNMETSMKIRLVDSDSFSRCNSTIILQNLLYKNPLYKYIKEDAEDVNVLVVGGGTYAQRFIDICLQTGQMVDKKLNIDVVSSNADRDKKIYTSCRPALEEFVSLNQNYNDMSRYYAGVCFKDVQNEKREFTENDIENKKILASIFLAKKYCYVFIALGSDELNKKIAKICKDILKNELSSIHYVQNSFYESNKLEGAVYINQTMSAKIIDKQLERMAFNIHLCWDSGENDVSSKYKRFREKYAYTNSIASALSIRYKLASVGITTEDIGEAAAEFQRMFVDELDKNIDLYRKLVMYEHRRWLLNKVVDGWKAPRNSEGKLDFEVCIRKGAIKNVSEKLHPCIVKSSEHMILYDMGFNKASCKKWEEFNDFSRFDELDRMSVELHQYLQCKTEQLKQKNPLYEGDVKVLFDLMDVDDQELAIAYNKYIFCLKNILDGNQVYSKKYDYYEKYLLKRVELCMEECDKQQIKERIAQVRKHFFVAIENNMFRDYKAIDEDIVKNIPFILCYKPKPYMIMAFDGVTPMKDTSEGLFRNVASATFIEPERISYLYYANDEVNINALERNIGIVREYFDKKMIRCKIEFLIAFNGKEEIKNTLGNMLGKCMELDIISGFKIFSCLNEAEAIKIYVEKLKERKVDFVDGSTTPFESPKDNADYIYSVSDIATYFEFNTNRKKFEKNEELEYLNTYKSNACIRIDDMFALGSAIDNQLNLPEFAEDYHFLWGIYSGNDVENLSKYEKSVSTWIAMCNRLGQYANANDKITEIIIDENVKGEMCSFVYYVPSYSYAVVKKVIMAMKKSGCIASNSVIRNHTSESCKIDIITKYKIKKNLDDIFYNIQILADERSVKTEISMRENRKVLKISYDFLSVEGLGFDDEECINILEAMSRKSYINILEKGDYKISFSYSSPRVKRLLTDPDEILVIYTYYKCKEEGFFDDIACGYEFRWADRRKLKDRRKRNESGYEGEKDRRKGPADRRKASNIINEIDCILTKGFKSLFVECKTGKIMDQNYYNKLYSISDQFGINTTQVIIANTFGHNRQNDVENDIVKDRGKKMNIITVSSPKDIQNIGEVLKIIMLGKYETSKE